MASESSEERFKSELFRCYEESKEYLIPKAKDYRRIDSIKSSSALGVFIRNVRKSDVSVILWQTFDVIKRAHIATEHGGRDRMIKELQRKYANITTKALELFRSLSEECQKKRKRPMTNGVVVRPILSKDFASKDQVDLIDMQSMPHSKWIMVYQDHLTKFYILRPLQTKRATEVAFQLVDIFLLMSAPAGLQSDEGSEFTSRVITKLKEMRPSLTMVHGKPRHPQSQGSVERANGDIKDMLLTWFAGNHSQDWSVGMKFVQCQKNAARHSGIKCSPYSAMFGCEARQRHSRTAKSLTDWGASRLPRRTPTTVSNTQPYPSGLLALRSIEPPLRHYCSQVHFDPDWKKVEGSL
ncbi:KRAB-A domain-containing protein 2-like [Penaeus indicus]|uniref:KRAB-A domain-containing protein 2-like n=1 Tax=Penaeus indicus TaxID=29960 RepID=UPI00300D6FC0